jgi:proteic killer suppression protein
MIRTFKSRALKRLYDRGAANLIRKEYLSRIEDILARLDIAETPQAMAMPGYNLHPLKGKLKGFWSVKVSGNWRIIFRFKSGDVFDVNLIDYH